MRYLENGKFEGGKQITPHDGWDFTTHDLVPYLPDLLNQLLNTLNDETDDVRKVILGMLLMTTQECRDVLHEAARESMACDDDFDLNDAIHSQALIQFQHHIGFRRDVSQYLFSRYEDELEQMAIDNRG